MSDLIRILGNINCIIDTAQGPIYYNKLNNNSLDIEKINLDYRKKNDLLKKCVYVISLNDDWESKLVTLNNIEELYIIIVNTPLYDSINIDSRSLEDFGSLHNISDNSKMIKNLKHYLKGVNYIDKSYKESFKVNGNYIIEINKKNFNINKIPSPLRMAKCGENISSPTYKVPTHTCRQIDNYICLYLHSLLGIPLLSKSDSFYNLKKYYNKTTLKTDEELSNVLKESYYRPYEFNKIKGLFLNIYKLNNTNFPEFKRKLKINLQRKKIQKKLEEIKNETEIIHYLKSINKENINILLNEIGLVYLNKLYKNFPKILSTLDKLKKKNLLNFSLKEKLNTKGRIIEEEWYYKKKKKVKKEKFNTKGRPIDEEWLNNNSSDLLIIEPTNPLDELEFILYKKLNSNKIIETINSYLNSLTRLLKVKVLSKAKGITKKKKIKKKKKKSNKKK